MNKVILTGRFTKDVEIRYTGTGKEVANFTLAVNKPYSKNKQDGPTADFINCIAWEKRAELIGRYFAKGSAAIIEGRLQTRTYDAKDGSKRYVTEVLVTEIEFAGSKADRVKEETIVCQPQSNEHSQLGQTVSDDDIPF